MGKEEEWEDLDDEDEDEAPTKGKGKSKASSKKAPAGVGAGELAAAIGVDPKQFRTWLRNAVKAGEVKIPEREGKARYTFGNTINSPLAKTIIKAYKTYQAGVSDRRREQGKKLAASKGSKSKGKKKVAAKK
ncbi:MAG: hypothetical protein QQN63_09890 [Nitrosopumilus sp.]